MSGIFERRIGILAIIIVAVISLWLYLKNLSDFLMTLLMFVIFGLIGLAVSKVLTSELKTRHRITPLLIALLLLAASVYLLGEFFLYLNGEVGMASLFKLIVIFLAICTVVGILYLREEKTSNTILLATLLGIVSIGLYVKGIMFPLLYMVSFGIIYVVIYRLWTIFKPDVENRVRNIYSIVTANSVLAFAGIILYRLGFEIALTAFVLIPLSLLLLWMVWSLLR